MAFKKRKKEVEEEEELEEELEEEEEEETDDDEDEEEDDGLDDDDDDDDEDLTSRSYRKGRNTSSKKSKKSKRGKSRREYDGPILISGMLKGKKALAFCTVFKDIDEETEWGRVKIPEGQVLFLLKARKGKQDYNLFAAKEEQERR